MRGVGLSFCGSQSRAGRSLPQRRPATDVAVGPRRLRPALKLNPKHCTVSASLRLRFRSAVSVARWNFISILLLQNERNPSLSGRATFFCAGQVFRASFFARALAEILFKAHDAMNDFLLQRSRAGRASTRIKLPCAGGVRVTPAGRSDTAYRLISSAQFFARALAEILFKRKSRV